MFLFLILLTACGREESVVEIDDKNVKEAKETVLLLVSEAGGYDQLKTACKNWENSIDEFLKEANNCEEDNDCVAIPTNTCELGCYAVINEGYESKAKELINDFRSYEDCPGLICLQDCPFTPEKENLKCYGNVCHESF